MNMLFLAKRCSPPGFWPPIHLCLVNKCGASQAVINTKL